MTLVENILRVYGHERLILFPLKLGDIVEIVENLIIIIVGCLLDFSTNVLIQWGKTLSTSLQTITLPMAYSKSYIGLTTTIRNIIANANEGGNSFYIETLTTAKVAPCAYMYTAYWMTVGY